MDVSPWIKELTPEQLPEPYRSLAPEIGMDATIRLAAVYQGTGMYFPKLDTALAAARNSRIRAEFDGSNQKALAVKYGITERWVYEILGNQASEDQISLFQTIEAVQ